MNVNEVAAHLLVVDGFSVWRENVIVVDTVSFAVRDGEVLALQGENGAGKTSLLEGLAGLHASTGVVRLRGVSGQPMRRIALCPDGRHLFNDMSVAENLLLGGFRSGAAAARRDLAALRDVVPLLEERLTQRAGTLSGGEQQLIAVCRALMARPDVLLLDSPTSGLGPVFRTQIADLVLEFVRHQGHAVLVADDDAPFLQHIASRFMMMERGRLSSG